MKKGNSLHVQDRLSLTFCKKVRDSNTFKQMLWIFCSQKLLANYKMQYKKAKTSIFQCYTTSIYVAKHCKIQYNYSLSTCWDVQSLYILVRDYSTLNRTTHSK